MTEPKANFYADIVHSMRGNADKVAFQTVDQTLTYAELELLVNQAAGVLQTLAIGPGERVLAQVGKSVECVALYLACLQRGVVYVPINTAYTEPEVAYFLDDSEPALFVCQLGDEDKFRQLDVPLMSLGLAADGSLAEQMRQVTPCTEIAAVESQDMAAILYTSGTTGRSKGAMLSHGNLSSNAHTMLTYWGWENDDVLLHALPIFHVHGLFVALHCSLLGGSTNLFLPSFTVESVIQQLPQATVMMGVPTFYSRLLSAPEFTQALCAHVRLFISGSAPLTEQTFNEFEQRTGMRILERYGMSETLMLISNPLDGERQAGTVGYGLPAVEVRIADAEGNELSRNEVGVIEVRGPNVFAGYWRMPEKTATEFRADGYFITGDMGIMSTDGRVSIVGREKDLVISGGYNVYPKEVERLLDEMPEVVESAVIGVPHADFGEAVVAVLVVAPDSNKSEAQHLESVKAYLGEQLAKYKQPKAVYTLPELPRNAMGKVQKNQLREEYKQTFS